MLSAAGVSAADLPKGFVYLSDIDPTISQDLRYAGPSNFTHAKIPGYRAAECILTEGAAQALASVQSVLSGKGYGLQVLDCYRPAKAVRHFVRWASAGGPADPEYYPKVPRNRLIQQGYIGRKSGHSAGATVDLTLVRLGQEGHSPVDMGTGFDFFDPMSQTQNPRIPAEAARHRAILVRAMKQAGFANYRREWWHFSFRDSPFSGQMLDFDIKPKSR